MEFKAEAGALTRIWEQLNRAYRPGRSDRLRTAHRDVVGDGWGLSVDVQDILWETDDRADLLARHNDDFEFLLAPSGLQFVTRYRGPFSNVDQVCGHKALRAADVAEWVMQIERLGFSVDAEPLVAALRPALLRSRYLTNSELSVVWYKKQRHRCEALVARVPGSLPTRSMSLTTHSGYVVTALLDGEQVFVLRVDAHKKKDPHLKYWVEGELYRARQTSGA